MLLRLIRTYLAPYRRWLTVVATLQFAATVAMLFLPSLNADIIDNGVAKGDTGYIVRIGGVMLLVSVIQIACSVPSFRTMISVRPRPKNANMMYVSVRDLSKTSRS